MTRFLFALEANTRMIRRTFLGLLLAILAFGTPLVAASGRNPELSVVLSNTISKLDREAAIDSEAPILLADLGSGFGLFQEALDFRHIDSPRPTKIHDVPGDLAKGDK